MAIKTVHSLREHLQWALEIEHATIPPYLTALYSIKEGHNPEVVEVLKSVFMEEMLHMTLAANVMNAVGGTPHVDKPGFIPHFPAYLPHSNKAFIVPLLKFSREAVDVFLKIERPEDHDALPEDNNYHTIGQFYEAIEEALVRLSGELGEDKLFTGDPSRQVRPDTSYYGGSGLIIPVENLESALAALDEIKEQGEGHQHREIWDGDRNMFHPEKQEVAHYFRFQEILAGRGFQLGDTPQSGPTGEEFKVDWDGVYNMRPNPHTADYPKGSEIREQMDLFNRTYSSILRLLQHTFNGQPDFLRIATGAMYELTYQAIELMKLPSGDGETTVGPSFEYVPHQNHHPQKIIVMSNGPYIVYGEIPLVRKAQVISEYGEPLAWHKTEVIETEETYALCRCGQSSAKPFCDGTHARIKFDGTETAETDETANRQTVYDGTGIVVKRDTSVCMEAGFCGTRLTNIIKMMGNTDDTHIRSQVIAMVERCPSGSYTYRIDPVVEDIEPDLPKAIAVTAEGELAGALWVTGGIHIERADGQPLETRNRVTLCRCGMSSKKPLCDGTHRERGFKE
jgi:CDGSH-type Zn-finger protein